MLLFFNHKITVLVLLLSIPNLLAGQNFKKAYTKAFLYINTNSDSCLKYTQIAKVLADNDKQRYKAFYMVGYVAINTKMNDLAIDNFQKAMNFAQTGESKYRCYNSIGRGLFNIGENIEASKIANECIKYFSENDIKENLSYAYDLKANILLEQYNHECISFFEKSLKLKNNNEKGFVYHQIAKAFYKFGKVDKAIHYQRKSVDQFPLQDDAYKAKNRATLAKYLIKKGSLDEAANQLEKASLIKSKDNEAKAIVSQAWTLYHLAKGQKVAIESYARFDALMSSKVNNAKNVNDKKAYCKTAIALCKEVLEAKPGSLIKQKCLNRLTRFESLVEGINGGIELKRKEQMYRQIYKDAKEKYKKRGSNKHLVWWFFFATIAIIGALLIRLLSTRKEVKEFKQKNAIIARIEHITKTMINDENKMIIELLANGESYKNIAKTMDMKEQTVRRRMIRLAEKANKTDIRHLF